MKRLLSLVLANCLLMIWVSLFSANFLRLPNLLSLLNGMSLEAILLAGVTLLMIGGQLDLSLDGTIAMSGVVSGALLANGLGSWIALLCGVCSGSLIGLTNGLAVNRGRVNPLVVTLATGWMASGIAYGLTRGQSFHGFPAAFGVVGQAHLGGVKVGVLYAALAIAVATYVLHLTRFGAHVLLVGDNPVASLMMGVAVERVKLVLYVLSGTLAGFVGVVLASRLDAATPIAADGTALRVIAAAVIGGTALAGGKGSVMGGVLGLVLMNTLTNAVILLGVDVYWTKTLVGGALLGVVLLDSQKITWRKIYHEVACRRAVDRFVRDRLRRTP